MTNKRFSLPLWHDFRFHVPLHIMIVLFIYKSYWCLHFHYIGIFWGRFLTLVHWKNWYNTCLFFINIRYITKRNKEYLYYSCQLTYDVNKQKLYIILLDTFSPLKVIDWQVYVMNAVFVINMYKLFCKAPMCYLQIFFSMYLF